jgi:hypothetical protein
VPLKICISLKPTSDKNRLQRHNYPDTQGKSGKKLDLLRLCAIIEQARGGQNYSQNKWVATPSAFTASDDPFTHNLSRQKYK